MGKEDKEFGSQVNLIQNDKSEKTNLKQKSKAGETEDFKHICLDQSVLKTV